MSAQTQTATAKFHHVDSSWIDRFLYDPKNSGGLLAIYTKRGEVIICSEVKPWQVGLLKAGIWRRDKKTGRVVRSSGSAYATRTLWAVSDSGPGTDRSLRRE
jgi:hypothetical protein